MHRLFALCLSSLLLLTACSEETDPTRSNTFIPLSAIEIDSQYPAIANLTENQFTAIGNFSGAYSSDITARVQWQSSDETILSFNNIPGNEGRATANAPGSVTVTASLEDIETAIPFTVTDAALDTLAVIPSLPSVAAGLSRQFNATGTFSDGTSQDLTRVVTWSSSDPAVAVFSQEEGLEGLAMTLAPGETTVGASFAGISDSTLLTVTGAAVGSLAISPVNDRFPAGLRIQYTATATLTDGTLEDITTQVVWESSDETVARAINLAGEEGEVETLNPGSTTISITFGGQTASTRLTVSEAMLERLDITPRDAVISVGGSQAFALKGTYSDTSEFDLTRLAVWTSSDPTVANISNSSGSEGVAKGLAIGRTDISASFRGLLDTTSLRVE